MIHITIFFSGLSDSFFRTFIIRGNANNGRNPPSFPFPALMAWFAVSNFPAGKYWSPGRPEDVPLQRPLKILFDRPGDVPI